MAFVPSRLIFKSGDSFKGLSPFFQKEALLGEVVFTTGMTGYVETLTDPSYAGQILVFTFPLIGNYGVPDPSLWESSKIQVAGVVFSTLSKYPSHYENVYSLQKWLETSKIPYLVNADTRAITKYIRDQGVQLGGLFKEQVQPDFSSYHFTLPKEVKEPVIYGKGEKKIILVDCGMKENILRSLLRFPVEIKRVHENYDYSQEEWDGVLISNGPGDPITYEATIAHLQKALLRKKPIFGICLGAQLMALAIGSKTYKLAYGHRGQNQPCLELKTNKCFLTSQNHGYAIDETSLPREWEVSFQNLNDRSVEGIQHKTDPFFAVQFHPEAWPGPCDTEWLFQEFYEKLC